MIKLKKFGFFDDLSVKKKESLEDLLEESPHPDKGRILDYLRKGHEFLLIAGITRDPIGPGQPIIGAPHVATDGHWAWTADVAYYVDKYNIRLPDDFVKHMRAFDWEVPRVEDFEGLSL